MIDSLRARLFYFVVLLVFFLSGAASLIYQVAWQRALTMYYGVGAVSVAIVVAVFMGGLGLGSVLGGWLSEWTNRRIGLYVACELGIAAFGAASLPMFAAALPVLAGMGYASGFLMITALLLWPTTLMGMTLPLMVKIVNGVVPGVGRNVALLYFANTLGAAAGAIGASYGLISFYGLDGAILSATGLNLLLCVLMVVVALTWRSGPVIDVRREVDEHDETPATRWVRERWLMFGSGLLAIGYQMIWFRILSTLLKPNSYVFSTVLGVYLLGIALGSLWMSRTIDRATTPERRLRTFYVLNAAIAVVTLVTFVGFLAASHLDWFAALVRTTFDNELHPPYRRLTDLPGANWREKIVTLLWTLDIVLWPAALILPATMLMGASFPLVTASAIGNSHQDGRRAGVINFIAIAGNVAGALLTGFVLLPMLGTERTLLLFTCAGALWMLGITDWRGRRITGTARAAIAGGFMVAAIFLMPGSTELYAALHPRFPDRERIITEDIDGTAVTFREHDNGAEIVHVYIGGSSHATFPSPAYQTEVLETATYARRLENVLIIGFGGGDLTDRILKTPGVGRVTIVEISSALARNIRQIPAYQRLLDDPRVHFEIEDGRRFLQRTHERFDALLMDPLQSTSAYSNNLYSLEFFTAVRNRLTDDGVAMVWFNEYYIIPKTIAAAFPHMQCFYFFCLASPSPMVRNDQRRAAVWAGFEPGMRERVQQRLSQPYYDKGGRDQALSAAANFPINRDMKPYTEYYVGYIIKSMRGRF